MGYTTTFLLAFAIAIVYNLFIVKMSEIMTLDLDYDSKIQKSLVIGIIGSIIGFIMAKYLFGKKSILTNKSAAYGLTGGSLIILINTLFFNWDVLDNGIKLFIIGTILLCQIYFSYNI